MLLSLDSPTRVLVPEVKVLGGRPVGVHRVMKVVGPWGMEEDKES